MQSPSGLLKPGSRFACAGSQSETGPAKRFAPNLAISRQRRDVDGEPRPTHDDLAESDSTFREKNRGFYFHENHDEEDARKRPRGDSDLPEVTRKLSTLSEDMDVANQKNFEFYFPSQLAHNFNKFTLGEHLEEEPFIEQAITFAKSMGGECLSHTCNALTQPLLYKCKLGHTWESDQPLRYGEWCHKCREKLKAASEYAESMGGRLISTEADVTVEFECHSGHRWCADGKKYRHQKWCLSCKADARKQQKEEFRREQEKYMEELRNEQQRLFEEARKKLRPDLSQILASESQIEAAASEMAANWLKNPDTTLPYSQVFNVYKILNSTNEFIQAKYFNSSPEQITKNYRQLARVLHPDKNLHPRANDAFLKVMKVYSSSTISS